MFHVEQYFSVEIVRAAGNCSMWNISGSPGRNIEDLVPRGTILCHMFCHLTKWSPYKLSCEMCAAVFHVERSFPKPEVGVQNSAYPAKQFASRVRMGDGAACSAEITGKSYLERKQVGCHVPRGTKSQNRSRSNAGGKSLALSSRWVDDRGILCAHEEEAPK